MEMNFPDLRKRKEHGVRKTMESQKEKRSKTLKKKKIVPLGSYRKFRNIKTKKQNPMIPKEIVYHIENNQDYIETTFSNSCNRCKKKMQ